MAPKPLLLLFLAILLLATAMSFAPVAAMELQAEEAKEQLTAKQMGETEGVGEDKKVCYYIKGHRVCHPPAAQAETHSVEEQKRVCYYVMGNRVCHPPEAQAETHGVEEEKRVCYYVMGHRVCHPPEAP